MISTLLRAYPDSVKERSFKGGSPLYIALNIKLKREYLGLLLHAHPNGARFHCTIGGGAPVAPCDGWTLLFSAFLGRMEIIAWLHTQPVWRPLATEVCKRIPFENAFAVHIAATQGHILIVDLMLALKVQAEDADEKSVEDYANKSQHKFAREWAAEREREKPERALEENIKLLLRLVKAADSRVVSHGMFTGRHSPRLLQQRLS